MANIFQFGAPHCNASLRVPCPSCAMNEFDDGALRPLLKARWKGLKTQTLYQHCLALLEAFTRAPPQPPSPSWCRPCFQNGSHVVCYSRARNCQMRREQAPGVLPQLAPLLVHWTKQTRRLIVFTLTGENIACNLSFKYVFCSFTFCCKK